MLPFLPTRAEIIAEAERHGWRYSFRKGRHILTRANPGGWLILQTIQEDDRYAHAIAVGYARVLGIAIAGEANPVLWAPTDEEQT